MSPDAGWIGPSAFRGHPAAWAAKKLNKTVDNGLVDNHGDALPRACVSPERPVLVVPDESPILGPGTAPSVSPFTPVAPRLF